MAVVKSIFIYYISVYFVFFCNAQDSSDVESSESPLHLTPLLEDGNIIEAQRQAKVNFYDFDNVTSYSGFINVNKTYNSEMFFWYFPSRSSSPQQSPVILWIQGGPGTTGLVGVFAQHGPFQYVNGNFTERTFSSWNEDNHIIYLDSPVGTGFSRTDKGGYSTNIASVAENLYIFILQFFKMFPNIKYNDFYLCGESYAGKYIPVFANMIHERNKDSQLINLKGVSIGSGLIDPINQISFGDYFYTFGLLDKNGVKKYKELEEQCIEHIKNEDWINATDTLYTMLCGSHKTRVTSLFFNLTGFQQCVYILDGNEYMDLYDFINKIDDVEFRKALHIGNSTFSYGMNVFENLETNILQSVASHLTEILNHYRVILYGGQLDVIVPYPLMSRMIDKLNFSSSDEWHKAERLVWRVDEKIAGYMKCAGNLTEIMVINAGHSTMVAQPKRTYDIIKKLTFSISVC